MASSSLYDKLMKEGKKLAAEGKLYESLSKLEHAKKIQETPKVLQRIQQLKEFIKQDKLSISERKEKESFVKKVEKTRDPILNPKTLIERRDDVLQEIQNVAETTKLPDYRSELSPASLIEFNKLKKEAMSYSYEGQFHDALNTFQKALQLYDCPAVKKYINDIKVMIANNDAELQEFRQLTYSGRKLAHSGNQNLSVKKLKDAFDICPSPKISKIIKTLDERNNSNMLFNGSGQSEIDSSKAEPPSAPAAAKISEDKNNFISKKLFDGFDRPETDCSEAEVSPANATPAAKISEGSMNTTSGSVQDLSPATLCKFKNLYKKARVDASEGRLQESLNALKEALTICKTEKILKRIKDLEEHVKNTVDDSDDQMVAVADGFYLFHGIYEKLYPYQRLGTSWMYDLFRKQKGGVLGDDMGLGKTFQVIAFLSGLIDADLVKHILIIMPVSLLTNWEREFAKWCPGIKVSLFHGGTKKERERNALKVQRKGHVLLTSYGMVVNNLDSLIYMDQERFIWDYVILDEGHKIKNPTKTTKAVHEVPAKNRLVLTGTPVQNNLRELWALYDFVHQGALLGSMKTFKMQYENIITRAREKDATVGEKRLGTEMAENLKKLIQPYFLRRTKAEIWGSENAKEVEDIECKMADLKLSDNNKLTARKNDLIIWLAMSDQQCEIYRNFLHSDAVKSILVSKRSPLVELTTLKKICDHPRLLSQRACLQLGLNGELNEEDLIKELDDESKAASSIENVSDETLIVESGKMKFLISLLENLKENGHRTLVFSLSRKILDMIHRILVNRQWKVVRIDGTVTKTEERERRIQLFQRNTSYPVFLLTTQVGGVGITLTAADRVVIYDPSWNPATDAQAVDRAYRIGQEKNVVIYRLMTCGTVEEKIYRRQIFKDSITRQATGSSDPYRYFSKQELRELFVLENANYSATQVQLSQMHSGERRTDCSLDEHIAFLHSLDIFGISDHDLMFSKNLKDDTEDNDESAISHDYIKKQVAAAQERIQAEAAVVEDGLRLAGSYTRPYTENIPLYKNCTEKDFYKPPSFPDVIDLTQEPLNIRSSQSTNHSDEDDNISSVTPEEGAKVCKVMSAKKKDSLKYKPLSLEKNKITDYYCPDKSLVDMNSPKLTSTKEKAFLGENFQTPAESIAELKERENASFEKQSVFNSSIFTEGSDSVIYEGSNSSQDPLPGDIFMEKPSFSCNDLDAVGESSNKAGKVDKFKDNLSNELGFVEENINKTTTEFETCRLVEANSQTHSFNLVGNDSGETSAYGNAHTLSNIILNHEKKLETSTTLQPDIENNCSLRISPTVECSSQSASFGSLKKEELFFLVKEEKCSPKSVDAITRQYYCLNKNNTPDHSNNSPILHSANLQIARFSLPNLPSRAGIKNHELTAKQTLHTSLSHHFSESSPFKNDPDLEVNNWDDPESGANDQDDPESGINDQDNPELCINDQDDRESGVHDQDDPKMFVGGGKGAEGSYGDSLVISDLPTPDKLELNPDIIYSVSDHSQNMPPMCRTSSPVQDERIEIPQDLTLFLNEGLQEISFIGRRTSTLKNRKSCARNMQLLSESDSSQQGSSGASQELIVCDSDEDTDSENSVASIPLSVPSTPLANKSPLRITPLRLHGNYISPVNIPFAKALASSPLIRIVDDSSLLDDDSPLQAKRTVRRNVIASDSENESSSNMQNKSSSESDEESECFTTPRSRPNSVLYSCNKSVKPFYNDSFSDE